MRNPVFVCFADDNITARQSAALVTERNLNFNLLQISKAKITAMLDKYIEHLDHALPNLTASFNQPAETPRTTIDARSVTYGEMLLVDLAKRQALDPALNAKVLNHLGTGRA